MAEHDVMALMAQHRLVGDAPAEEHRWFAAHGTMRESAVGDVITPKGVSAISMHVLFSGHLVIRVDRGAGAHVIIEWRGGDVGGLMPYSRGAVPPSDAVAEEPCVFLDVPQEDFPEMIRECPVITTRLVHAMIDRVRLFVSSDSRDEKLISLGKLAAGLAHELSNPASAALRSAKLLDEGLAAGQAAAGRLAAANLSGDQLTRIHAVRELCNAPHAPAVSSAVARADREEEIGDWLVAHGANESCAGPLSETAVTLEALDGLAAKVTGDALDAALRWISAGCLVRALSGEIETAASRVYELVGAVKGFTYMDRAPSPEPVDIRRGIGETLMMLRAKTNAKSAAVSMRLAADLPCAHAVGAELNQVWMNLIDNALDAVEPGGHVEVTADRELDRVVVRIIDDGAGIPAAIQGRIFDPFFTTKGVGEGTGLGLDIVRRLIQRHEGGIEVESRPGRTEFRVRLPVAR